VSRLLARLQRAELQRQAAAAVQRALNEADVAETKLSARSAGGDEERLRNIPVIGRGIPGVQRGTRPGDRLR
jgi:hypothetical protein